jgi:hypothetical protein
MLTRVLSMAQVSGTARLTQADEDEIGELSNAMDHQGERLHHEAPSL